MKRLLTVIPGRLALAIILALGTTGIALAGIHGSPTGEHSAFATPEASDTPEATETPDATETPEPSESPEASESPKAVPSAVASCKAAEASESPEPNGDHSHGIGDCVSAFVTGHDQSGSPEGTEHQPGTDGHTSSGGFGGDSGH